MVARVLVVDDSATMRGIISAILKRDPDIDVVATAADAFAARDAIIEHTPDVITLDFEMPGMDGISFLQRIMDRRPTPVIMISSATNRKGADLAIAALSAGAFDCIAKPEDGLWTSGFEELPELVKAAARTKLVKPRSGKTGKTSSSTYKPGSRILAIGASTGGVEALSTVLRDFPENCPPTVIVQHMPANFTASFAERLNKSCQPEISEARNGDLLRPGHVYIAPGGIAHLVIQGREQLKCRLVESEKVSGHRPSVDMLFQSVAATAGRNSIGVILTGMGADGADGLLEIRKAGGVTFGQNEVSSIIYGMPRVAYECGAVQKQLPLRKIAGEILRASNRQTEGDDAT